MILQKLVELAEREGLVEDPSLRVRPVEYLIRIATDGRFLGIESTLMPDEKGKLRGKPMLVPPDTGRTAGVRANFLCDNVQYVLGQSTPGKEAKPERVDQEHGAFLELLEDAIAATADPGLRAVLAFLRQPSEVVLPEKMPAGAMFTFLLDDDIDRIVLHRPAVRAWWRARFEANADAERLPHPSTCLVTGETVTTVQPHPSLKKVPNGQSSGCALISFNLRAFESNGWNGNGNAVVSRAGALAYTTALNRLLDWHYPKPGSPDETLPRRRVDVAPDTAILFWASREVPFVDFFDDAVSADPQAVASLYASPHTGTVAGAIDEGEFYALTVSGSAARVVLRGWFETSVTQAAENLKAWFDDIAVPKRDTGPSPLWLLLAKTAMLGKRENILPGLAGHTLGAILRNTPLPQSLLAACVQRNRAEQQVPAERAALIQAWLRRARRSGRTSLPVPEVTMVVDEKIVHPAYRLGRAFAVLEKLQKDAINPSATIRDRYFGAASATPATVMPRLIRGAQPHISKAGSGGYLSHLLGEILAPVTAFPKTMNLEQQGLFALGYYHQNAALYTKREKAEETAAA